MGWGMNRKPGNFCPTYTALWCFSTSCPGACHFPHGSGGNLQPTSSLVTAAAANRGGRPRGRESWLPRATDTISIHTLLQTCISYIRTRTAGHAIFQASFSYHEFAQSIPSVWHVLPVGLASLAAVSGTLPCLPCAPGSTVRHPASPFDTHAASDCCPGSTEEPCWLR